MADTIFLLLAQNRFSDPTNMCYHMYTVIDNYGNPYKKWNIFGVTSHLRRRMPYLYFRYRIGDVDLTSISDMRKGLHMSP